MSSEKFKEFKTRWCNATPETRKFAKQYWLEVYESSIFPETFREAEQMLLAIRELETEAV